MENPKNKYLSLLIVILVAVIAAGILCYYLQKTNRLLSQDNVISQPVIQRQGVSTSTRSEGADSRSSSPMSLKTYNNKKFGFQFSYPSGFGDYREYPNGTECKPTEIGKGTTVKSIEVASINNLSVNFFCGELTEDLINQWSAEYNGNNPVTSSLEVGGTTAYKHEFVTSTGYTWKIIQIPFYADSFVQISYTYGNSYRLNNAGYEMSNEEWQALLASFKAETR